MKKLALVLVFLVGISGSFVSAAEVYSEDFTVDPGFTTSNEFGIAGQADTATWNSTDGWYQVHLKEYGGGSNNGATKFAVTPSFSKIENTSFTLSFDTYYHHNSFGMGMQIWAIDGPVRDKEVYGSGSAQDNVGLAYNFGGNDSAGNRIRLYGKSQSVPTPFSSHITKGVWYSHTLSYDSTTEFIDYVVTEKSSGNVFFAVNQLLPIGAFDRLAFGHITANFDGTSSELWFDNINVTAVETDIKVVVDIKPGSCLNPLNIKSKGVLPVAILGTQDYDVLDIDALTIQLAGVDAVRSSYEDVGTPAEGEDCATDLPDGILDLVLKFDTQAIVEAIGEVTDGEEVILELIGLSNDDTPIVGQDYITIRAKGKGL